MPAKLTTPRAHGTRTRYLHGPLGTDARNGCRCTPCCTANTMYQKRRRVRVARQGPILIDAGEARRHVAWLRRHGLGRRNIARLADVDHSTIYRLDAGAPRIRADIADRILNITLEHVRAEARYIPAGQTRRLLDALLAAGWTRGQIAKAVGNKTQTLTIASYGHTRVTARNAAKIEALARRHVPGAWAQIVGALPTDEEQQRRANADRKARQRDRQKAARERAAA